MYRRAVLGELELETHGFFYQTELLIKSIKIGYLYAEVPCSIKFRQEGQTKAIRLQSFFDVIKDYLKILMTIYFFKDNNKKINPILKVPKYISDYRIKQIKE